MSFEVFPRGKHMVSSRGADIAVRCGPQRMTLSKAATQFFNEPNILLLWDKENKRVAMKPTSSPEGHRLTKTKTSAQSYLTCASFLKASGLKNAGILYAVWDEAECHLWWDIPNET